MKLKALIASAILALGLTGTAQAAENYVIDTPGAHAFIQFRVQHLGYSWLYGRFNTFEGQFTVDEDTPTNSSISLEIDTASVDTNHAERDKHLRSADFLNVDAHPTASFVSTAIKDNGDGTGVVTGDLTLNGVTKPIDIAVTQIGHGPDPWGGYRRGFEGTAKFAMADYGITYNLGPASTHVEMTLSIEGIRQ